MAVNEMRKPTKQEATDLIRNLLAELPGTDRLSERDKTRLFGRLLGTVWGIFDSCDNEKKGAETYVSFVSDYVRKMVSFIRIACQHKCHDRSYHSSALNVVEDGKIKHVSNQQIYTLNYHDYAAEEVIHVTIVVTSK